MLFSLFLRYNKAVFCNHKHSTNKMHNILCLLLVECCELVSDNARNEQYKTVFYNSMFITDITVIINP